MFIFNYIETLMYYTCICITLKNTKNNIPQKRIWFFVLPLVFSILWVIIYFRNNTTENIMFLILELFFLFSTRFLFKNSKFVTILTTYLFLYSLDIIVTSTTTFILSKAENNLFKILIAFIFNLFITIIYIILYKLKHSEIQNTFNLISKNVKIITLLSLIASAFLLTLISETSNFNNISKWNFITKIIISLLLVFIGAAFPILNINSFRKNFYMKQFKNLSEQVQIQTDYYISLAKSNFELRQFRHDFNNMKIGISELLKEGNTYDLQKMIETYDDKILSSVNISNFDTGNGIVDALLTDKQNKANNINTNITFNGTVPLNKIEPIDLCIIFGNTLDNAIEACEKISAIDNKTINVNCECCGGFMFLDITNPVYKDIPIHNNSISTYKHDKSSHGFGLFSLKQAIKKYEGSLNLKCKNKIFTVSIELCFL